MVPWLAARPLSGHATPVRRQQAPPQAEVDRSTPRHPGQSYRGSDPGPGRHRRSSQSYRDVEELLAERGITVDHVSVYRWVQRFTPLLIDAARPCRHSPGDRWFVDETYVKVSGRWVYLYRAIDQFGQIIDVLVTEKRDLAATRRFFTQALEHGPSPIEVTTDRAPAYPRVLDELLPTACHVTEQYTNNAIEADHGRLKSRLRPTRGLKRLRSARVISAGHAFVQNLHRGHYELGTGIDPRHGIPQAFTELILAI
jgi:IS6 family transposase